MPTSPTYPGVYIEEVPSPVRTIAGVPTSITAFIGRTLRGRSNFPVRVQSFGEFSRQFGGLWRESTLSYAVQQFFANGGADAVIVRVHDGATAATISLAPDGAGPNLDLAAANEGVWGTNLRVEVDHDTLVTGDAGVDALLFNLTVQEIDSSTGTDVVVREEVHRNVSVDEGHPRYVESVLEDQSDLARVTNDGFQSRPGAGEFDFNNDGVDGGEVDFNQIADPNLEGDREGLWALDHADIFNLLCIPPFTRLADVDAATWDAAKTYCAGRRAMVIIDPPSAWNDHTDVDLATVTGTDNADYAAFYFPRIRMADALRENRLSDFAPSGAVAGIYARTDRERGVWKAPGGLDATISGARELTFTMTDGQNGILNPLGVNCLRTFPVAGHVVWGARTMAGADRLASQWKYVPVRRLALYIEESLYRGTQWVIFEPNDEPLWAQIRLNVGAFMHNLFRQGAFQGSSPRDAYFVKCDSETTTQNDIDRGIVNLMVGFAPLKPAEFLIIHISQIAGEIQT